MCEDVCFHKTQTCGLGVNIVVHWRETTGSKKIRSNTVASIARVGGGPWAKGFSLCIKVIICGFSASWLNIKRNIVGIVIGICAVEACNKQTASYENVGQPFIPLLPSRRAIEVQAATVITKDNIKTVEEVWTEFLNWSMQKNDGSVASSHYLINCHSNFWARVFIDCVDNVKNTQSGKTFCAVPGSAANFQGRKWSRTSALGKVS